MAKIGAPYQYTDEMAVRICTELAQGNPLTRICRKEGMPDMSTVYRWLLAEEPFRKMYAQARADQADTLADEIISISDEAQIGEKTITKADGKVEVITGDMVERAKLRVDARKWVAAKLKPRKYSDRLQQEISGPNNGPVQMDITISAEEAYKKMLEGGE